MGRRRGRGSSGGARGAGGRTCVWGVGVGGGRGLGLSRKEVGVGRWMQKRARRNGAGGARRGAEEGEAAPPASPLPDELLVIDPPRVNPLHIRPFQDRWRPRSHSCPRSPTCPPPPLPPHPPNARDPLPPALRYRRSSPHSLPTSSSGSPALRPPFLPPAAAACRADTCAAMSSAAFAARQRAAEGQYFNTEAQQAVMRHLEKLVQQVRGWRGRRLVAGAALLWLGAAVRAATPCCLRAAHPPALRRPPGLHTLPPRPLAGQDGRRVAGGRTAQRRGDRRVGAAHTGGHQPPRIRVQPHPRPAARCAARLAAGCPRGQVGGPRRLPPSVHRQPAVLALAPALRAAPRRRPPSLPPPPSPPLRSPALGRQAVRAAGHQGVHGAHALGDRGRVHLLGCVACLHACVCGPACLRVWACMPAWRVWLVGGHQMQRGRGARALWLGRPSPRAPAADRRPWRPPPPPPPASLLPAVSDGKRLASTPAPQYGAYEAARLGRLERAAYESPTMAGIRCVGVVRGG